jgi:hypothetical protein
MFKSWYQTNTDRSPPSSAHGSNLGSVLLCITNDGLINVKNELILWKLSSIQMTILNDLCVQIELNSNIFIEFDLIIELWFKFNWRKLRCKLVEKVSKLYSWVQCFKKKKNFKRHKFIKTHFHVSLLGNGLKKFNLRLSTWKPKVVLPKSVQMNYHHQIIANYNQKVLLSILWYQKCGEIFFHNISKISLINTTKKNPPKSKFICIKSTQKKKLKRKSPNFRTI